MLIATLGARLMGARFALALSRLAFESGSDNPVQPVSIAGSGARIVVTFSVDVVRDASTGGAPGLGFAVTASSGPAAVTGVAVIGPRGIPVALEADVFSLTAPRLRYACAVANNVAGKSRLLGNVRRLEYDVSPLRSTDGAVQLVRE